MDDYLRSGTVTPFLHTASAVSVALPLHLTPIRAAKKEGRKRRRGGLRFLKRVQLV